LALLFGFKIGTPNFIAHKIQKSIFLILEVSTKLASQIQFQAKTVSEKKGLIELFCFQQENAKNLQI